MRPLVIVPYRDRPTHLNCFLLYMNKMYPELRIVVVEQVDNGPWNKGLLFNAAYRELVQGNGMYMILHDVDFIPVYGEVDYSYYELPTMIAGRASQFDYKLLYRQFFGGVVVLPPEMYEKVNGFSNLFRGWGGEDDMLYRSFVQKGIQPQIKDGKFECFTHPRLDVRGADKNNPDYLHNLALCTSPRNFSEGLSTAEYKVAEKTKHKDHIHLKIDTSGQ